MRRAPVHSSAVVSIGYDPALAVLEIEFTGGDVYRYFAVPRSAHRELIAAESIGRHFLEHIRDVYPAERVR